MNDERKYMTSVRQEKNRQALAALRSRKGPAPIPYRAPLIKPVIVPTEVDNNIDGMNYLANPWDLSSADVRFLVASIDGSDYSEISSKLGISKFAVSRTFTAIYRKTQTNSRIQVIMSLVGYGLLELDPLTAAEEETLQQLTSAEKLILSATADGLTREEIMQKYAMTSRTLRDLKTDINRKIETSNPLGQAIFAARAGLWISPLKEQEQYTEAA